MPDEDFGMDHLTVSIGFNPDADPNDECDTCGKELNPAWNYCPRCGRQQHTNTWNTDRITDTFG